MLRTPLLDLLGIQHPIIQAGMGTFGSGAALAAAVSGAGAIGTIGAAKRSPENLEDELAQVRMLTDRPFMVSFTRPWLELHPECLEIALAAGPRAISFSAGLPGSLASRIHGTGALIVTQVQTMEQARLAADEGSDVVVAQGFEAGGPRARIGGLVLVPEVVAALSPLPVVAAGGIVDGRGLAAVLTLGAAGACIGTRFIASVEAAVSPDWKERLVGAGTEERIPVDVDADGGGSPHDYRGKSDGAMFSLGQGTGGITSIQSAAQIVAAIVRGAEASLQMAAALVAEPARRD